ncbi:tetratricopeptide repeat protein [Candidatus Omnitrophota bacterium]
MRIFNVFVTILISSLLITPFSFCQEQQIDAELEEFDFANGLFARGMYDMAVDGYKKFLKDHPKSRYAELANFRIAECYFMDGKYEEALNRLGMFLKQYPSGEMSGKAALRRGQIHYLKGDFPRAEKMLTDLSAKAGDKNVVTSAQYYLAGLYFKRGDYTTSKELLEKVLSGTGDGEYTAFAYMNLGDIYTELKDHLKAAQYYDKAVASTTDKDLAAKAAFRAGNAYYIAGDYDKAESHYNKAIGEQAAPATFDNAALGLLSTLYKNREYDQVIESAQKNLPKIKGKSAKAQAMFILGNSYFHDNRFEEAEKVYTETAKSYPDTSYGVKSLLNQCWTFYKLGKYKECLSAVQEYMSKTEESTDEALYVKAKALAGEGNIQQAIKTYQKMNEEYKDSHFHKEVLYEIGWLYTDSGEIDKALPYYHVFIDQYPKDSRSPSVLLKAAQENLELKRYEASEKDYKKFLSMYGDHSLKENATFQLGRLYMEQGNYVEVANIYDQFVKEFPESEAVDSAVYWKGRAYQENQEWDKAIATYVVLTADKKKEFYAKALESMAYSYFQKGNKINAANNYYALMTETKDIDLPDGVYKWVADFYLNAGQHEKSLEVLNILSKKYPDVGSTGEVVYMFGESYSGLKDWKSAERYLKKAIDKGLTSPYLERSQLALGKIYSATGDHPKALRYLEEALKNHKDNLTGALARYEMGNVNFNTMNFEEAAKQYMMVAILYDDEKLSSEALFKAGQSFNRAGMPEKATEAFQELIERYPGSPFSKKAADEIRRFKSGKK